MEHKHSQKCRASSEEQWPNGLITFSTHIHTSVARVVKTEVQQTGFQQQRRRKKLRNKIWKLLGFKTVNYRVQNIFFCRFSLNIFSVNWNNVNWCTFYNDHSQRIFINLSPFPYSTIIRLIFSINWSNSGQQQNNVLV